MRRIVAHIRSNIVRGLLAIIPIGLTLFVVHFLYILIDRRVVAAVDQWLGVRFPGLGLLLVLVTLYLLGVLASNVVGRQVLNVLDRLTHRIPVIRTTYEVGKQLSSTLSLSEKQVFQRAVLVPYLRPGIWTVGFVTGSLVDRQNDDERLLKVFVPTPPNPASGTMVMVRESDTRDPGWTVEQALRAVISGGIIGPEEIAELPDVPSTEQVSGQDISREDKA